jgi:integrase
MVAGFASYAKALHPLHQVPAAGLLGYRYSRPTPFLYSQDEIDRLLASAGELRPPWRATTHQTLFGLFAVAGLRVGEAIRLDRTGFEYDAGLLTVRDTKFKKSRRVPLHPSTVQALARYADQRDRNFPRPQTESFFVSVRGSRLLDTHVHATFRQVLRLAAIEPRSTACRPRMHGLRHSFAVNTLLRWYQSDAADVGTKLPLLSAYLGHVSPTSTYWYLEASPELLASVNLRLERAIEALA